LGQQRAMIRALAPDATVELGTPDSVQIEAIRANIAGVPEVRAVSKRVEVPCVYFPTHEPPQGIGLPGVSGNYYLELLGIDPKDERAILDLDRFLHHDRCALSLRGDRPDGSAGCDLEVQRIDDPFRFSIDD